MIRQFFLNKVTIVCAMIFMVGCSSDSVTNETIIEDTALEKRRPGIGLDKTMEVLIEYVEGTDEKTKMKVRDKYFKIGLLLSWEDCEIESNENVEVWIMYNAKPQVRPESDDEDVDKAIMNANCNDYR